MLNGSDKKNGVKKADESTKQNGVEMDEVNIKRSIEMKNGIALRSMNNFHKGTNAISLNIYKVSILFKSEHLAD